MFDNQVMDCSFGVFFLGICSLTILYLMKLLGKLLGN